MKKILTWIDNNIVFLLSLFLLSFIPLYPKLPLFDALPGYIVRVRVEDFLIALTIFVFAIQLLRKKVALKKNPVSIGLVSYLIIGFISSIVAVLVIHTVPMQLLHYGKTLLHWLRRVEYFSLFFILVGSIRSMKQVRVYVFMFFLTLVGITIYGYGQKYLYWPAFSTMNREFSKGWMLYLTEHARVLSTFGGHYDLAGYLVIALSLCWSFFLGLKNKLVRASLLVVMAGGFWLLILTASRISFGAYIIGISVVVFLWTYKKGFGWGVTRLVGVVMISIFIMLSFGDLSERFSKLLKLDERFLGIKTILLRPAGAPPTNQAQFLENNIIAVTTPSDTPPTPVRPVDVNKNEAPLIIETKTASGASVFTEKPRTYSKNAVTYDLSTGIRLDTTWPQAINGFKLNPLTGKGYATLTKVNIQDFTEAESTDNDYLRALGETGFLGFATFFGTIIAMAFIAFKSLGGIKDSYLYSLICGFVGAVIGLLFNATYIDIFEASKVAYVFWGVSGLSMGALFLNRDTIRENMKPMRIDIPWELYRDRIVKFLKTDILWMGLIVVLFVVLRTQKINNPIADWHSWRQADTSAVTRNFIKDDRINWLFPTFDDLSSVASGLQNPKGLRFVEFPIYNATTVYVRKIMPELTIEAAGRFTTVLFGCLSLIFIFLLTKLTVNRKAAYLSAIVFTIIPYSIFYGQVVLPDPTMVAFSLGGLYFVLRYFESLRLRNLFISSVFVALAILVKPFAIFLLVPILYLGFANHRFNLKKWVLIFVTLGLALLPFVLWRLWMSSYPEGIPANNWLFNGDGIRFKGAFWYWIFAERIGRLILGYWGLLLLGFGLMRKNEGKYRYFPVIFLFTSLVYLIIVATGNVRHDYYQILIIPSLSIIVGMGLDYLLFSKKDGSNLWFGRFVAVVSFAFMFAFGWYYVKDYFNINHPEIVEAGKYVDDLTRKKGLVIAPYGGDTAFLYQTNRKGWPLVEGNIGDLMKKGAHYYVSVNFDDLTKELIANSWPIDKPKPITVYRPYKLIKQTDKFVIIQLVPDSQLPKD